MFQHPLLFLWQLQELVSIEASQRCGMHYTHTHTQTHMILAEQQIKEPKQ
jgi:hypothetical protein